MSKKVYFETPQGVKLQFETASVIARVAAFFIDTIIYYLGILLIIGIFGSSLLEVKWIPILLVILFTFLPLFIEIWTRGQSIGKILLRIQVISNFNMQADKTLFFSRYVIKLLEIGLTMGLLPIIAISFSKRGQSFADYFSGALVVVKEKSGRFNLKELSEIATKENYEVTFPQVTKLKEEDIIMLKNLLNETKGKINIGKNQKLIRMASDKLQNILGVERNKLSEVQFISKIISDYIVSTR